MSPLAVLAVLALALAGEREDALLDAVRKGDAAAVKVLLDQGLAVDTKFRYDRTPLSFAADRGHVEVAKLLLERGANPKSADTFYGMTPLTAAASKGHTEIVRLLMAKGATFDAVSFLVTAREGNADIIGLALGQGTLPAEALSAALEVSEKEGKTAAAERLRAAGAVLPPKAEFKADPAVLARYAGQYKEDPGGTAAALSVAAGVLQGSLGGGPARALGALSATTFRDASAFGLVTLEVKLEGERVTGITLNENGKKRWFPRVEAP
jgi:hypothetical protein